jgi:hypothetical protein
LCPYELLEMRDLSFDTRIPHEIVLDYVQPYFEAKVLALSIELFQHGTELRQYNG